MFGKVDLPFNYGSDRNSINIKLFKGGILYRRVTGSKEVEKRIYSSKARVWLSPVKPFNCPKMITSTLMVELGRTLVVPPKQVKTVFLRFPVEIAVIASREGKDKVIDVFTDNPPKYSMYGDIKEGVMCRYYGSDVYVKPPRTDANKEGLLEVRVKNSTSEWREVSMLVFEGILMKIYYSNTLVSGKAKANIIDDEKVETSFSSAPLKEDQKKAFEILTQKTFKRLLTKFTMEGGY
jgi:hypothetical protein